MAAIEEETWEVLGDGYCGTLAARHFRNSKMEDDMKSKLWLDVKANVTVTVLPRVLEDEEDLENHYKVMLLEDIDQMGQSIESIDFEDKLEIDLDKNAMSPAAAKAVSRVLSGLINVPSLTLLSAADKILCEALRARARGTSLVHMEALIEVEVVEESDDDAFVPATKSSIDKLERVRVETSSAPGFAVLFVLRSLGWELKDFACRVCIFTTTGT